MDNPVPDVANKSWVSYLRDGWDWVRLLFWTGVFGLIVCVWFQSVPAGEWISKGLLLLAFFVVYFLAEGMELAYTDLRDKDEDQLRLSIQARMKDMRLHEAEFYEAREYLVIALVFGATWLSHFEKLKAPWAGEITNEYIRVGYSLLFTTIPFIWLAQSPAKSLATRNSEAFLEFNLVGLLWTGLKYAGKGLDVAGLFLPSQKLTTLFRHSGVFGAARNLPPSNPGFFLAGIRRYGSAACRVDNIVTISQDGAAKLKRTSLIYVAQGKRRDFKMNLSFDSDVVKVTKNEVTVYAFQPPGEKIKELLEIADAVWGQKPHREVVDVTDKVLSSGPVHGDLNKKELDLKAFLLTGMPEGLASLKDRPKFTGALMLRWEIEVETAANAFRMDFGPDSAPEEYFLQLSAPCLEASVVIQFSDDCKAEFVVPETEVTIQSNHHLPEMDRIASMKQVDKKSLILKVPFPLSGAKYSWRWKISKQT